MHQLQRRWIRRKMAMLPAVSSTISLSADSSCPLLSSIRSLPGKHRRELRLRLFRPLHCMSDREKKGPHHIYHDYQLHHHYSCAFQHSYRFAWVSQGQVQATHTSSSCISCASGRCAPPSNISSRFTSHASSCRSSGCVSLHLLSSLLSRQSALQLRRVLIQLYICVSYFLLCIAPLCTCSSLSHTSAGRCGPSEGATSGNANSGQCIVW